ncbi:MAG: FtsX-like permease family protein [Acidobacteriia bacterium]|nr:FtsX-like permease family protein [Terriglobia bacterium]
MNKSSLPWRTAAKIAIREIAASKSKFVFIALALSVGVGSLAGVRGFGRSFRAMLLSEARTLMAADLSVRVFELPTAEQTQVMDRIVAQGARRTQISETVSMLSAGLSAGPDAPPVLVSIKAVDPAVYPFYGQLGLLPPGRLSEVLRPDTIAVSSDLLIRLDLKTGDRVRLGNQEFRIAAVVDTEPDRMAGSLNVGPRVLLSREALDNTGLIKPGSRSAQRHLFRLDPARQEVEAVRKELKAAFSDALITDFRETHPLITRGLNRSERFLSLISLIALIIGALGVAATMHSHLQQRLDSIAILKCLGARTHQIVRIYLAQTLVVGLAGGLLGCVVGIGVQAVFPLLIEKFFAIRPSTHWDALAALEAITVGLLTAILFTLPALLSVQRIRPSVILRRDHESSGDAWSKRWRAPAPWITGLIIALGIAALAAWLAGGSLADATKTAGIFAGGLLVSLLLMGGVSWGLLRGLKLFLRNPVWKLPSTLRHGIANIYRPGNQAQAVLVSLGVGVMFTLTVFLIQRGLLQQMLASAPPNMPNVFLLNITGRERDGVEELLRSRKEVQGKPEVVATIAARLRTVNGAAVENLKLEGPLRRFRQARAVSQSAEARPQTEVVQGAWWTPESARAFRENHVCVIEDTAKSLSVKPGSRLEWTVGGKPIQAVVACVYKSEEVRMGGNMDFVFSTGSLEGLPLQYFAAARMRPASVASFQRASFARFPSVTVINGADVLEIVQQVVDQIALVVRFISLFSILAGIIILASSVAATRFRRVKEVAILKTLGASRRRVMATFSVEFLVLGLTAGLLGSALATGFANLLLVSLMDAKSRFDLLPNVVAVALSAIIATVSGWLASYRILKQKPLEVLRGE